MTDQDNQSNTDQSAANQARDTDELETADRELTELEQLLEQKKREIEAWQQQVKDLSQEYADWGLELSDENEPTKPEERETPESLRAETDIDWSENDDEAESKDDL